MTPQLFLSKNNVHVWVTDLNQPSTVTWRLLQTLSSDECQRANRFRIQRDKDHFIVAHGVLRIILSYYLGVRASDVRFCCEPMGKPELERMFQPEIRFNLSHSHGLCLYAIAREHRVGIDLELVRPLPDMNQIIQSFFSPQENAAFLAMPPARRQEMFFKCWTRKEAYLKGTGEGLCGTLDRVEVLEDPTETGVVVSAVEKMSEKVEWQLQTLRPVEGYIGGLAVEGKDLRSMSWQYNHFSPNEFI